MLVLEALGLLADDAVGQVVRLVDVRGEADRHELLTVFLAKVAQVRGVGLLLLLVDGGVVAHGGHLEEVTLAKLVGERDGKVERAVAQMVVVVLVLVDGLHEGYWVADLAGHLVEDEAWTLIQDKGGLAVL